MRSVDNDDAVGRGQAGKNGLDEPDRCKTGADEDDVLLGVGHGAESRRKGG